MRVGICILVSALMLAGCQDGGSSGSSSQGGSINPGNPPAATAETPLIVSAGVLTLEPEANGAAIVASVDLARLGLSGIDAVYDFTSPSGEPFAIHVTSREENNSGQVSVSLAHALSGGATPSGDATSLAEAGIIPSTTGTRSSGTWLAAQGDGFARLSLQGSIAQEEVLALTATSSRGTSRALIRIRPGAASDINLEPVGSGNYPHAISETDIYSSNSRNFGLPVIALSGDRASLMAYEGDTNDPLSQTRYEMRLQVDTTTGAVTGGALSEPNLDSGNWRDHELAALYNVLVRAHAGQNQISVDISFDRGATFGQQEQFPTGGVYSNRLVQVAMADDYSLAVVFWRSGTVGSELMLWEASASAFDATGSPTAFSFLPPAVLRNVGADVTPSIMGVAFSAGGDLVVGYGYSSSTSNNDGSWTTTTAYRCAVREYGQSFRDTNVETEEVISFDPSVSLLGQGSTMQIFYAYEARDGIRLRTSSDAGLTFSAPIDIGNNTGHMPSVFARSQGGQTRVDLLYLSYGLAGSELHITHWDDWGSSTPATYRLTTSTQAETKNVAGPGPLPGAPSFASIPNFGLRITQLAWLGYDAVLDGDDILIGYVEQTYDAYMICFPFGAPGGFGGGGVAGPQGAANFSAAAPPPLAPGLTQPVASPDADHMSQMRLLRVD